MNFNFISKVLFVKDIEHSKKFYIDVLNQEVEVDYQVNIGFKSGLALWDINHAYQTIFKDKVEESNKQPKVELYFETDHIEDTLNYLESKGVHFIHKIETETWNQKTIRFYDPDFNVVEIGETVVKII